MMEKQLQSKSVNLKRCSLKIHARLHESGEPACDCLSSKYHGKKTWQHWIINWSLYIGKHYILCGPYIWSNLLYKWKVILRYIVRSMPAAFTLVWIQLLKGVVWQKSYSTDRTACSTGSSICHVRYGTLHVCRTTVPVIVIRMTDCCQCSSYRYIYIYLHRPLQYVTATPAAGCHWILLKFNWRLVHSYRTGGRHRHSTEDSKAGVPFG